MTEPPRHGRDAASGSHAAVSVPEPDAEARRLFGTRIRLAQQYAQLLAGDGVAHGHLGPREVPRIWERHLVNCAGIADLIGISSRVVDVGTGAGLPGIALALCRPDLSVDLVEPMQRRVRFLEAAVEQLGLESAVRVVRGRAEDRAVVAAVGGAPYVVSRAVAPLDRLVRWCVPLLEPGGVLLAMKGASARAEVAEHAGAVRRAGGVAEVLEVRAGTGMTEVIRVTREATRGSTPRRRA